MAGRENGSAWTLPEQVEVELCDESRLRAGGWIDFKGRLNPVVVPNPAFLGLVAVGVITLGVAAYYLSSGDHVGWFLVVVSLFLFAAAFGASLFLRIAGIFAAVAVFLLVLSLVVALPV